MSFRNLFVLVAFSATSVACGGNSTSPSALPTNVSPTPGKIAGNSINPTLLPNTFAFRRVSDSLAPSSSLSLWDLRGQNSEEGAGMMSFCGKGVTAPGAQENSGFRPLPKAAGSFRLVVGPEFTEDEYEIIRENALVMQNELGVPLSVERGVSVRFSGTWGVINVFKNSDYAGWAAARLHVQDNLIYSGDMYWGKIGIVQMLSVRHELGHIVGGLCHHNEEGLMSGLWTADRLLSKAEKDNYEMMKNRLAEGTVFPISASSASRDSLPSLERSYTRTFDCTH